LQLGGACALSLLLAACGENRNAASENRSAEAGPTPSQGAQTYSAAGQVTAIAGDRVTIAHGPVEGIGWPAMTMNFRTGAPEMVQGVQAGDRISFEFRQDGEAYVLTSLRKAG
jgi:Cu/Ag efflux protein CusF